jgi:glutamate racemase
MNNIGIFDSGVGGLGIFQEVKKLLPRENITYLADTANCPYGDKSTQTIKEMCQRNTQFLIDMGAKIVVVACNTASVSALNYLRSEFPSIPIVGVVPVVKTAAEITKNKRIGILATKRTLESDYLKGLVNEFCPRENKYQIYCYASGDLVNLVENIDRYNEGEIAKKVQNSVKPLVRNGVDVIALGCTHFPFLKDEIKKIAGEKVVVLDSNGAVARQVQRVLTKNKQLSEQTGESEYKFYTTFDKVAFKLSIKNLIGIESDKAYLLKWK